MKILVCAPCVSLVRPLIGSLVQMGFSSYVCCNPDQARDLCRREWYDAVLVWHEGEAQALLREFASWKRESSGGQFVVLTERQSGVERARALEAGVDHYHIAPFSYARVVGDIIMRERDTAYIVSADYATKRFCLRLGCRLATCDGQRLALTRREFDILLYLLRHRGSTLSRVQIWDKVWGEDRDISLANPIDVHVARLRKKLPPEARRLIRTVYGTGYRMHAEA